MRYSEFKKLRKQIKSNRKGYSFKVKMDEVDDDLFVDFPNNKEREQIFKVHICNRKKNDKHTQNINFRLLAEKTEGFSGADIETVVKETIEEVFINNKDIAITEDYLNVVKGLTSISEMLPKQVKVYRKKQEEMKIKLASK